MRLMTALSLSLTLTLAACADDPKVQPPLILDDEPDLISDAGLDQDVALDMAPDQADPPDLDVPDATNTPEDMPEDMPAPSSCPRGITWAQSPEMPGAARDHHATFITTRGGPRLHVVGGTNYQGVLSDHWSAPLLEDGALGGWQRGVGLPAGAAGQGVAQIDDEVFLLGGRTAAAISPQVYRALMDDAGQITGWEVAPPLPQGRFHNSAAVHGRTIYISGGLQNDGLAQPSLYRATVREDGSLSDWETLELPAARSHHSSLVYNDQLYLLLGLSGNPFNNQTTDNLDIIRAPLTEQGVGAWETVTSAQRGLTTQATTLVGDCALTLAGLTITPPAQLTYHNEVHALALDGQPTWGEPISAFMTGRSHLHQAPHHGGYVYIVGGSSGYQQVVKSVEIGRLDW